MMSGGHLCEVSELLLPLGPQGCNTSYGSGRERGRGKVFPD